LKLKRSVLNVFDYAAADVSTKKMTVQKSAREHYF